MSAKKYEDVNSALKSSLLKVMEYTVDSVKQLADPSSVLGEAVEKDGVTVIPVSRLSVGFAGGGADVNDEGRRKSQNPAGAGAKIELSPVSFLVISENEVKTVGLSTPAAPSGLAASLVDAVAGQVKKMIEAKKKK